MRSGRTNCKNRHLGEIEDSTGIKTIIITLLKILIKVMKNQKLNPVFTHPCGNMEDYKSSKLTFLQVGCWSPSQRLQDPKDLQHLVAGSGSKQFVPCFQWIELGD